MVVAEVPIPVVAAACATDDNGIYDKRIINDIAM
jgi:hypothetical protein